MSQNLLGAFRKQLTIGAVMGQKADSISGSNFLCNKITGFFPVLTQFWNCIHTLINLFITGHCMLHHIVPL